MFNPQNFISQKMEEIKKAVGNEKALVALSGGVDSSTTAVLGFKALGEKLEAVFIDDGLMREGEGERISATFASLGLKVQTYSMAEDFFKALKGLTDPEEKRKAFREAFYQSLAKISRGKGAKWLLQGTIAADVVETSRGVKTQHNVLEQVGINPAEKYGFKVVEPLKELYKPQVREVAKALGLPAEITERRPFPGPGLCVRVLGEVTPERVETVRKATRIVEEETAGLLCFQAFAVLMEDKATGLSEDKKRIYGEILVIRSVDSTDAMTAQPTQLPWPVLEKITRRITASLPSVTRVLYDLTGKPPATIEFE
ncbi:glutamine-hydrolyzing GMP synthase [Candidatus Hecatella orcuttiae]|jgi:GMP synthase (glutamine-hydrolysing)|uniref:glutamine-hydrolyzing GMP synthase n=1 Tax=Candidatus Hecatella orcuttiae TaxID=1935119 RepID=UPI002867C9CB|nr:glutamine-hydrolyzing GMP synthase [Candidatus Hecatella orcuttiae]